MRLSFSNWTRIRTYALGPSQFFNHFPDDIEQKGEKSAYVLVLGYIDWKVRRAAAREALAAASSKPGF